MTDYLVFVLHAPIASFGGVAVGERRGTQPRPARSAIIGLLAAALGITRDAADILAAMDRGYGIAVRVDAAGVTLTDYHTAQVPPARRGERHATRRAELAARPLETILSRRDYRTDALATVAVWARIDAPFPLAALREALGRPGFVLSVGRKSCPLGLPPAATLVEAPDIVAAIAMRAIPGPEAAIRGRLRAEGRLLAMDPDGALPQGVAVNRTETRRDGIASRQRWQFSLRPEAVVHL